MSKYFKEEKEVIRRVTYLELANSECEPGSGFMIQGQIAHEVADALNLRAPWKNPLGMCHANKCVVREVTLELTTSQIDHQKKLARAFHDAGVKLGVDGLKDLIEALGRARQKAR